MTGSQAANTHAAVDLELQFQLLGPVEARVHGIGLDLGGSKPCGVLALLLLSANRPVPVADLIDGLWAEDAPRTAAKMIQVYVSRIRHQLGDDGSCLHTTSGGYQLRVPDAAVDLIRFETLTTRARAVAGADPAEAAGLLAEALSLWRGPALANVRKEAFAAGAAARLDELRMSALEARIDADLAAGRHRAVIAELQQLITSNRTREHLGAQLMLALYRSGRQAEALATAETLRANLDEELGIAPGPAIAGLQLAILRQESSLDLPTSTPSFDSGPATDQPSAAALGSGRRRPRWRRPAAIAAVATAAAVALIAGFAGSAPREPAGHTRVGGVPIKPSSLLVLDGSRDSVIADLSLGGRPDRIAVADDSAWVGNTNLRTVTRIDLTSDAVRETFGLATWPSNIATSGSDVWISDGFTGTVTRLFATGDHVTAPFYPDGEHSGLVILATDAHHLYTGLPDGRLLALATDNLRATADIRLRDRVAVLADFGSTVCAGFFRASAVDCLRTPDLSVRRTGLLPTPAIAVTCDSDNAWALAGTPASIWHLGLTAPDGPTRLDIPSGATAVAASSDYLWVLYGETGKLLRLPVNGTGPAVTLDIGQRAAAIATWHNQVLISLV